MTVVRIMSVRLGVEVGRAELVEDGSVVYAGPSQAAREVVRTWQLDHDGSEADAVRALARDGWSNGYLMAAPTA